jgi:hypothetical protein
MGNKEEWVFLQERNFNGSLNQQGAEQAQKQKKEVEDPELERELSGVGQGSRLPLPGATFNDKGGVTVR